nr:integrase, catalytic region, zinc finger, CCHC-type, peptidase aspartic, catalytic [Tanacetum cinerariifolium]
MANLSKDIQCAGSDTRPPMLDRTDFASWQQRIRLYCWGKESGVNILKSIDEGPYQMGTVREPLAEDTEGAPQLGPERPRVYSDMSPEEKDRYNADIRATNILLQGLPKDIYTLINYYTDAKDIWDNHKRESIHDYYVRFAKLINDIRNIKMTMSRMQLNSKFVNNMLPEWGRFVTSVKLNRGLRDSNYDQSYAYLKQHETHAKENKIMLERAAGYGEVQNRFGNANLGQARQAQENGVVLDAEQLFFPAGGQDNAFDDDNSEYYNDKMLLMQAQENGVVLDAEQLLFPAGGHDNAFDDDVDEQPVQDLALNVDNVFQADDCDAFDSDMDKSPTTQTMFMANLSSADRYVKDNEVPVVHSDVSSVPNDAFMMIYSDMCEPHAQSVSNPADSNMIPYDQYVKDNEVPVVHSDVSSVLNDAFMMIYSDMCEPHAQSVSNLARNTVVKNSLTAELATYKEQVELITPTGLTEGERGFKQTKECYLKEVILFFKTLKDNFKDIQKALTKEIKEMKDVFEELEAEVAQYVVDRKHDAIEQKNLLIANDNLIAECLSKEVFSVATNSELNVARFTEMHVANTLVEAHCLALEDELANLRNKSHHDNQEELLNCFSKLEVNHLDLQLKYQNLKDSFGKNPPTSDIDTPDFDSVFVIGKMQASLQGKDNVIRQLKKQIS